MNKRFWIFLYIFVNSICIFSCTRSEKNTPGKTPQLITVFSGEKMTIPYKIIIGHLLDESQYFVIDTVIQETFQEVDRIYNKWNPNSELSELNRLPAGIEVPISEELEKLLNLTQIAYDLTDGLFDPTVEPLQRIWKNALQHGFLPEETEVEKILPAIGWENIHFENGVFSKKYDATALDLGGIAKGYCVDLLTTRINLSGFPNILVEWGGEIRSSGIHPTGRPWNISVNGPTEQIQVLELSDMSIAGSGDYIQYWVISQEDQPDEVYFHLINPISKKPLKAYPGSIAATFAVTKNCVIADALATALMIFPSTEEAKNWIQKIKERLPECSLWIIPRKDIGTGYEKA